MRIEVITVWEREAALAPFFLEHYRFADRIHVLVDARTDEATLATCGRYPNVGVERIQLPEGFDAEQKVAEVNRVYRRLACDWVFAVDADQLLFPLPWGTEQRPALNREHDFDAIGTRIWQVYRHRSESDLDPRRVAVTQRRHGDPHPAEGAGASASRPIIVRGGLDGVWTSGLDAFGKAGLRVSPERFGGAHWDTADLPPGAERDRHLDDPRLF